jgi:hypothetical protein
MTKLKFAVPTPEIGVAHPDFGFSPPPVPPLVTLSSSPMAKLITRDMAKRSSKPLDYHLARLTAVKEKFNRMTPFANFMVESDFAEMATMCDIGERSPTHFQSDEGKAVGSSFQIDFMPDVVAEVMEDWKIPIAKAKREPVSVKIPSNTSLGWPFFVADNPDKVRAFLLACEAAAIVHSKDNGMSLRDVHSFLENTYGPRFLLPITRTQHTAKVTPVISGDGLRKIFTWTKNYAGRVRLVSIGDKPSMLYNKYPAKLVINAALLKEEHKQDRKHLFTKIKAWQRRPGYIVLALDVKGYDQGLGGRNLTTVLGWMGDLTGVDSADLIQEVTCPMLVPYSGQVYSTTDRVTPQLPSGVSFTTSAALLMGDYIALAFAKLAGLKNGKDFFYVNWGDDFLLHLPSSVDWKAVLVKLTAHAGFEFDEEPTKKYLGFNYGPGEYETRDGYSVGRLMIKTLLPERKSNYPFGLIGYAARLTFIPGDREKFHYLATQHLWDTAVLGPPFPYVQLKQRLEQALRDAATAKLVDTDVLNLLTHGVEDADLAEKFGDELNLDFDFADWIGNTFIDLTDPEKAIKESDGVLFKRHRRLAASAVNVGLPALPAIAKELAMEYNWRTVGERGPYK